MTAFRRCGRSGCFKNCACRRRPKGRADEDTGVEAAAINGPTVNAAATFRHIAGHTELHIKPCGLVVSFKSDNSIPVQSIKCRVMFPMAVNLR